MKSITAISNQSLFDIALQEYGAIDAVFDIAALNDLSISAQLTPGQSILLPEVVYEAEIAQYFKGINKMIATNVTYEPAEEIDYRFPAGEFPISL
ncbi:MAG: LysM domain-containing protein [Flavobacterium sp.]|nr:LysM domain-containing protein [Flavobacterium sp.]